MENTKDINELKANPQNPRTMSRHDADALSQSMDKFGDLSSIVFNIQTGQLVGGHQRIETLKRLDGNKQVQITQRFDPQTEDGTVALGYVIYNKKPFPYREVNWPIEFELAANIAANRIQGEFDQDLLAEVTYMIQESDASLLNLTGQTEDEVNKLLAMVSGEPDIALPDGDKPGFQTMSFTLSDEQADVIGAAIEHIKETQSFDGMENQNSNGNALYFVARRFLDSTES